MIFRDVEFFISEALIGMRRSSLMILIAIATITVSLVIFGFFMLLTANMNHLASFISSKLEIRVFLKDGVSEAESQNFEIKIRGMKGVKATEFVGKDIAWQKFKESFSNIDFSQYVSQNPFPDAIRVVLTDNSQIKLMSQTLKGYTGLVDDVVYGGSLAEQIDRFSTYTRWTGLGLVLLFSFATLLIVMNTIRLTIIARQEEIEIMQLVGATKMFIKWPFIIEGLILGVSGAAMAVVFLHSGYFFFGSKIQKTLPFFPLMYDKTILSLIYLLVGLVGATLGVIGAYISVSRSLKY